MAKEFIRSTKFRPESEEKIQVMNEIIEEYQDQGLRMTARQLYYQFVSRDIIPNSQKEYKKLTSLLTDARYAGEVDWDAIEDRGREPSRPSEFDDLNELVNAALASYRLPRWEGQKNYAELWVEKQALAGVLSPLSREFHATLMVNKGYSSASAMKESAERIKRAVIKDPDALDELHERAKEIDDDDEEAQQKLTEEFVSAVNLPVILYLGDHDPSGEDMVRDIEVRLKEFGVPRLEVLKVALTMDQVKKYNPPPNPAKITDPRAEAYIRKYGDHSWELDALPPDVLSGLVRAAFGAVIDKKKMDAVKEREKTDKALLKETVASLQT